ncbi:microcystin-dependent protein [Nonlabens dokdonensis]|jgi:microcystin-dependent protein|uniref:Phage Tail Collar n=2 Tax=Nonlabens dokdonensis TaxID=328515 RepID=L7W882_NONDD|nr:tail fiber protein [Nonlabens dokdonensis]AGC76011.1 phage Tail Collar [Nonlabens dokdonensis DSW-6]PZX36278.1 microcystin-dependent protein [Nonlabens dokdonensis]
MNPFIAQIKLFAGNFAPRGWALCHGQLLAISGNSALFSLVGTTYGGDGRTTFGIPDLRGRVAVSSGQGPGLSNRQLGSRSGIESVTLNQLQLPQHNHSASGTVRASSSNGDDHEASSANLGIPLTRVTRRTSVTTNMYDAGPVTSVPMGTNNVEVTLSNTGQQLSHENRSPFLALNYIIALVGTYPSRN